NGSGNDLFHIHLAGGALTVDVYTSDTTWTPTAAQWDAIARTIAGGAFQATGGGLLRSAPARKYAASPVTGNVAKTPIARSSIYYWRSSASGAIQSFPIGGTNPPAVVEGNCSSCHSAARTGNRIAYTRCVDNGNCGDVRLGLLSYDSASRAWLE